MMPRFVLSAFIFLLFSCHGDETHSSQGRRALYYWQTSLNAFPWRDSTFRAMDINKIYYRFFDVDWSDEAQAPVPVSPLRANCYNWKPLGEMVPVVFITNATFKNLTLAQCDELARQLHRKLISQLNYMLTDLWQNDDLYGETAWESLYDPYRVKSKNFDELKRKDSLYIERMKAIKEIQFDCDWTKTTRDKYFAFLQAAKKIFHDKLITSTVRLYQYRYPDKAGVPPVSRAMLMCYNAGDVKNVRERNSIFDSKEIMSYLDDASAYPVPLDYALPVFEWALWFQNGKLKSILSASQLTEVYGSYLQRDDDDTFLVKKDFVYGYTANSLLIRKGDKIKVEKPDLRQVIKIANWLSAHRNNDQAVLALYHLNAYGFENYQKEIEDIFNSF